MMPLLVTILALYNANAENFGYRTAAFCIVVSWLLYAVQNIRITYRRL